jgi:tRNA modification GTPase
VRLIDTAGIRRALDEAESIGIKKSMEALADADLVLLVLDASQPASSEDGELLAQVQTRGAIVIENKVDRIAPEFGVPRFDDNCSVVRTSALTGHGVDELRAEILKHVGGNANASAESGFLTNARHQGLVRDSLSSLEAAATAAHQQVPHEMLLLDLDGALRPLDEITGATTADDILNLIFGSFCVGK